jgi:hypothetical protein
VADEIKDELKGGLPTYDNVQQLKCLERVIDETLRCAYRSAVSMAFCWSRAHDATLRYRLYPPVPVDGKSAVNDDVLPDGTFIPAGVIIPPPPNVFVACCVCRASCVVCA